MNKSIIKHISPPITPSEKKIGPKILVNPYYGCQHRCLFCPANDGFLKKEVFDNFRNHRLLYVVDNILDHIESYCDDKDSDYILHLSPVTDPFQPLEDECHMSEKVIQYAMEKNIPVAICTKGHINKKLYPLLKHHPKTFVQISLLTINENKRKKLVRGGGATVDELLNTIKELRNLDIHVVVRVDPIFPFITDNMDEYEILLKKLQELNVHYVVSSVADIIPGALQREESYLNTIENGLFSKYKDLYKDEINGRLHAKLSYREDIFIKMKSLCENHGIRFGITWEPDLNGESINKKFSHSLEDSL